MAKFNLHRSVAFLFAAWALSLATGVLAETSGVSAKLQGAVQARIDADYAVLRFEDGRKSLVPLSELSPPDRAWLESLAVQHPLVHGNSKVTVVPSTLPVKKTIEVSKVEGALETVQLCAPSVLRDQIGPTCQLYAIVHCMDIAGFYVDLQEIYKIENMVEVSSPANPWADPRYAPALARLPRAHAPAGALHYPAATEEIYTWAREELRKGHPILAGLPKTVWAALPAKFIAENSWDGGDVGHAIVINGFTWNKETKQGTFHIINSWKELSDFDLSTDSAKGLLMMQWSLSAKNETEPVVTKEMVSKITLIRQAGLSNLYEVETNLGSHRVAAPTEADARSLVEMSSDSR